MEQQRSSVNICFDPSFLVSFDVFRCVRKIEVSECRFRHVVSPSVGPHGTTRLQLDGFALKLIYGYLSETCWYSSSYIEV